jgi:hypothetical protein
VEHLDSSKLLGIGYPIIRFANHVNALETGQHRRQMLLGQMKFANETLL